MGARDLSAEISAATTIAPAAIKTTTSTGASVDLAGYITAAAVIHAGAVTDGTHTPKLQESDNDSDWNDVAAGDLSAAFTAIAASTNQEVSYLGAKRYVRLVVTVTGSPSTGGFYSALIVRGTPRRSPA